MYTRTVTITKIGMPSTILKNRKHAKYRAQAMSAAGMAWFTGILPKHFSASNKHEYNEESRRAFKYLKHRRAKARRSGRSDAPLTLTCRLKNMVTRNATITASGRRVTIRCKAPYYAVSGRSSYIKDELAQLSTADRRRITMAFGNEYVMLVKNDKSKETVRVK